MKVGIIGAGTIAPLHAKAISSIGELTLYSACRRNEEELEKFCSKFNTEGFTNYEVLLKDEVDIVTVALPHALHYEVGMKALDYGCHLVMEKPFAVSLDECKEIYKKAKEKGLKIVTADLVYHRPEVRKAREIVDSGRLGRFISGSIINYKNYFTPKRPKWFLQPEIAGGGQLINVGVHRIAHVRSIIGDGEISVKASVGFFQPNCKVEGNGSFFIGYKDGSAVLLEENGYYKPHNTLNQGAHFNFENGILNFADGLSIIFRDGDIEYPKVPLEKDQNPYLLHYRELLTAIKKDKTPYPGAKEGLMDVRVILAAYESAKTGKEVRLDTPDWELEL